MNEQFQKYFSVFRKKAEVAIKVITKYKYTFVILVASVAVLLTLLQSRSYLNPPRNEARYQEELLKINTASVDQDLIDEISATLNDPSVTVDPALVPGRSNPFLE